MLHSSTPPGVERIALKLTEAASAIGVSKRHIYRLISRGEIDTISIGGGQRIPVASLREFVERGGVSLDHK